MLNWSFLILAGLILFCNSQTEKARFVSFRLYDGNSSSNSGILQVYNPIPGAGWMNICPAYYADLHERDEILSVVCKSLGYDSNPSDINASVVSFNVSAGPSLSYTDLRCTGEEADLSECHYFSISHDNYCYEGYNITCPTCQTNMVRLANGLVPSQGYVEVCVDGVWTRGCASRWGYTNSFVVCRQLGYPATRAVYTIDGSPYIRQSSGFVTMNLGFICYGNEESLHDCRTEYEDYCEERISFGFVDYILLQCLGEDANVGCKNGDVHLVGGEHQYEGVVQICRNGLWGTFSRTSWDSLDATVVCRQLNLLPGNSSRVTIPYIYDRVGTGPVLDAPSCTGMEGSISDCRVKRRSIYSSRSHNNDATVRCHATPNPVTECANGDVRLAGGPSSNEGRVELCYNGIWGSVCGSYSDFQNAAVVCRQLGYLGDDIQVVYTYIDYQPYGEATGPIHIESMRCNGYELDLLECRRGDDRVGYHTCSTNEDFAVVCDPRPIPKCNDGDLRLAAGYSLSDGVPQVCINGQWLSACYDSWSSQHSDGFCKLLLNRTDVVSTYGSCCARTYDLISSNSSLRDITCSTPNPEKFLRDCTFIQVPSTCTEVVVGCYVVDNCIHDTFRLANGRSSLSGFVQVCQEGVWGNIISYSWNSSAAMVACRQLGLPWEWAIGDVVYFTSNYNTTGAPFFYEGISCSGNEESLLNCSFYERYPLSGHTSPLINAYNSPARVMCQNNQSNFGLPPCNSGKIRLGNITDNGQRLEGRVEACIQGVWVVFCDPYLWTRNESRTICRQLIGYESSVSYSVFGRVYGSTNLPTISGLECNEDSVNINQCSLNYQSPYYFAVTCSHELLAAVVCERDLIYEVEITASQPPPYNIGQSLDLNCALSPQLQSTERPYYFWTIGNDDSFVQNFFQSGQNATLSISFQLYRSEFFFCTVYINDYQVTGYIQVSVNGLLAPKPSLSPPSEQIGHQYNFQVTTPTSSSRLQTLVYNLNWFYNGEQISNASSSLITNGNSSLLTTVQEGVYEVRYEGLLVLPYDRTCESNLLKFLRGYAGFLPTRFLIKRQESEEQLPKLHIIALSARSRVLKFTNGDNLTFLFDARVPDCLDSNDVDIKLYYNGVRVNNLLNYTKSFQGEIFGAFVVHNATSSSQGIYEVELRWNFERKCPDYYTYFQQRNFQGYTYVTNPPIYKDSSYVSSIGSYQDSISYINTAQEITLSKSYIEAVYYKSFEFIFTTNTSVLSSGDIAQLNCSALIGYPQLSTLSIVKNNVTLYKDIQSPIIFNSNRLQKPYGQYECVVNASGIIFKKTVTIKERVVAGVYIQLPDEVMCTYRRAFLLALSAKLDDFIVTYLRKECSCNFTRDDMQDLGYSCKNISLAQVKMTLEFSSDDAEVSASSLAQMLAGQIPISDLNVIVGESTGSILTSCGAQGSSVITDACMPGVTSTGSSKMEQKPTTHFSVVDKRGQHNGLQSQYMITTFIVVFVIGILISAVVTSLIIFAVWKYKQRRHASNGITRFENEPENLSFSEISKEQVDQDESTFGDMKY